MTRPESAQKQPAEPNGEELLHRLLRTIDRIGPEGDKGLGRPSPAMDGSRLPLCRPFLQQIGISVNPGSGGRFRQAFGHPSGAPRERAAFASFFLEIEAHAVPRANQIANAKDCMELHASNQ
jgi:hypothetical protein